MNLILTTSVFKLLDYKLKASLFLRTKWTIKAEMELAGKAVSCLPELITNSISNADVFSSAFS